MDARTFFDKVALMRKFQRDYFKYRRKSDLQQSKRLESEIDAEINRVHAKTGTPAALQSPPGLFDTPEQ